MRTYYVDANSAGGDGLSPKTAWRTIADVNAHPGFEPGDRLLFKCGCVFAGETLRAKGSGTENAPILLDVYGDGPPPVIDRRGEFDPDNGLNHSVSVLFVNQSWWTIRNIHIANHNPAAPGRPEDPVIYEDKAVFSCRGGLSVRAEYMEGVPEHTVRGIRVQNVRVRGIDGTDGDEGNCYHYRVRGVPAHAGSSGIHFGVTHSKDAAFRAALEDVLVEGCDLYNVAGTGITSGANAYIPESIRGLVVRGNRVSCDRDFDQSNHGMYFFCTDGALVEWNTMRDLSNGMAFQRSRDGVAQYNSVYNSDGMLHTMSRFMGSRQQWDGCGYDADTECTGTTVFRRNYSCNCLSGAFGFFDYNGSPAANIVVEENISVDDCSFIYYQVDAASYTFDVRGNTVVRTADFSRVAAQSDAEVQDGLRHLIKLYSGGRDRLGRAVSLRGNLFFLRGGPEIEWDTKSCVYAGNWFDGDMRFPPDETGEKGDSGLRLPQTPARLFDRTDRRIPDAFTCEVREGADPASVAGAF